jgi:hypothetical protein
MYKKKAELGFIHSFIPPEKMKKVQLIPQQEQVKKKQREKEKHLQLFSYFTVLVEMSKI